MISIRQARPEDIPAISHMLEAMKALKKRSLPADIDFVRDQYVSHRDKISCVLAFDEDTEIVGLQIFKRASEGNAYEVPVGWGIIGTHVHPAAARKGVGTALFEETKRAAINAAIQKIDATIGANNPEGLSYYDAIGFRTYDTSDTHIRKLFDTTVL